jgi:RNA polymerase sigma-70 factor (ECF subfamily)
MQRSLTPSQPVAAPELPCSLRTFEALYEAQLDFVYRCLHRLGVRSANIEDACQEVFIVLHRRLPDLRPNASERAFLFGIAIRVAADQRRKQARTAFVELPEQLAAQHAMSEPFYAAAHAQAARHMERFLGALDADQRSVFMLVELEDFTVPEVCEALGAKLNTVYSRLRLARVRFSRFVREEGLVP